MNPNTKVLNFIERTNSLLNIKNPSNPTTSSICEAPNKRVKKFSLSISDTLPTLFPHANTTRHSNQPSSSLDFVKNINFAIAEFSANKEKQAKSQKEGYLRDMKVLRYLRTLVREQVVLSANEDLPCSLVDRNIMLLAQEASQDICVLEKKCQELEKENEILKQKIVEIGLFTARDVIDNLKTSDQTVKGHFKGLKTSKIEKNYSQEVGKIVEKWLENCEPGVSTEQIVNYIVKSQVKLSQVSSNLQNSFSLKQNQRKHIEEKVKKASSISLI